MVGALLQLCDNNEARLLTICGGVLAACFLLYAFVITSAGGVFALLVPFSVATSCIYTTATAALSKAASDSTDSAASAGSAIGLGHSSRSFSGIVGPTLGGYVSAQRFEYVGVVAGALALLSALVL